MFQSSRTDLIELMLQAHDNKSVQDADLEIKVEDDDVEKEEPQQKALNTTTANLALTMEEMQANCFIFLIAGYETTSSALAFTAHELALNPGVQEKLQAEVDDFFPEVRSSSENLRCGFLGWQPLQ